MHGHGIDQDILVFNVRVVLGHLIGDLAPHPRGRHDVGLVHRGDLFAAFAGQLKRGAHQPLDLRLGIENRVHGFTAVRSGPALARPTVVHPAGQLTHDNQIYPVEHLWLKGRSVDQVAIDLERS